MCTGASQPTRRPRARHAGTKLEYMCMRPRMIGMYSPLGPSATLRCSHTVMYWRYEIPAGKAYPLTLLLHQVFIAPVTSPTSNPISYFELDTSPSGVLWAGLSNNSLGNSSVCVSADGCEHPGTLPCSGAAVFPHGLTVNATNTTPTSWSTSLFIPWSLFSDEFQPVEAFSGLKPWKTWRANFYRYDYPDGPHGTAIILRWLR